MVERHSKPELIHPRVTSSLSIYSPYLYLTMLLVSMNLKASSAHEVQTHVLSHFSMLLVIFGLKLKESFN
jgi:hypothetical protein